MRARQKNMLIGVLLGILLIMAVGYAAFSQNLRINATTSIDSQWNVKITDIKVKEVNGVSGTATKEDEPGIRADGTEAYFSSILRTPGDSITYEVTVTNEGSLKASLSSARWVDEYGGVDANTDKYCMIGQTVNQVLCTVDDPIYYLKDGPYVKDNGVIGNSINNVILPNKSHVFYVTAVYHNGFTYQPTQFPSYYSTGRMDDYQTGGVTISGNNYFEKDAILHLDYVQVA